MNVLKRLFARPVLCIICMIVILFGIIGSVQAATNPIARTRHGVRRWILNNVPIGSTLDEVFFFTS